MLVRHLKMLLRAGWQPIVITRQPHPDAPLRIEPIKGVIEHRLRWSGDRGLKGLWQLVQEAKRWLAIHAGAAGVAIAEQPFVLWAFRRAGLDLPYLYCCYSFAHEEFLTRHGLATPLAARLVARAMRRIEKRVYREADELLVLSEYTKHRLREVFGIEDAIVAPGGAKPPPLEMLHRRCEIRRELGWGEAPVLLTIRNLVPRTGVDLLVQAFAWLRRKHPELRLVVAGDGAYKEALMQLADALGQREAIEFVGFVSEETALRMRIAADLFVLPTRALEGFGLVTAEANVCGCPVVATPAGANEEVAGRIAENIVAARIDPDSLADAIEEGLRRLPSDDARLELARRAATVFSWQRHEKAFLSALDRACASFI